MQPLLQQKSSHPGALLGKAKMEVVDAVELAAAPLAVDARDFLVEAAPERARQAVIARYAQGQMRVPNVVKVRGCRHSPRLTDFPLTAGGPRWPSRDENKMGTYGVGVNP
jgi:hypothetical protein